MKHTPTPWKKLHGTLVGANGKQVAVSDLGISCRLSGHDSETIANTAQIVKCVNLHDELVAFIESLTDANGPYPELDGKQIVADARRTLAKARGGDNA